VIVESFARIHKSNLINFGILPLELIKPADRSFFRPGDKLRMANLHSRISQGPLIRVENLSLRKAVETRLDVTPRLAQILLAGGLLAYTRAKLTGKKGT